MLTVGDKLPAFKATACVSTEAGKEFTDVTNADYAGKWLVLYFYPKDFTFVCPTEIVEFDKARKDFADRDAVVVGGSTDNEFSHLAWRNSHADLKTINHPLIHLNPDFASALGVIRPGAGVALRVTFIVDPDGNIVLKGEFYLKHYVQPNFYFHVTTAYALLRHNGVELGKGDYLGALQ